MDRQIKIDRYRQDFDQKGDGALETEHWEAENWRKKKQINRQLDQSSSTSGSTGKEKQNWWKLSVSEVFQPILPCNHQYQTDYRIMVYATAKYNNIAGLWSWFISNLNHSHHFRLHHHRHYCLSLPHPFDRSHNSRTSMRLCRRGQLLNTNTSQVCTQFCMIKKTTLATQLAPASGPSNLPQDVHL